MPYPVIVVKFLNVEGLTLFPFIFVRDKAMLNDKTLIRHEMIHIRQQLELLVIPFYLLYLSNYLINLVRHQQHYSAYRQIIFEREAYDHDSEPGYLAERKYWAWLTYLRS